MIVILVDNFPYFIQCDVLSVMVCGSLNFKYQRIQIESVYFKGKVELRQSMQGVFLRSASFLNVSLFKTNF